MAVKRVNMLDSFGSNAMKLARTNTALVRIGKITALNSGGITVNVGLGGGTVEAQVFTDGVYAVNDVVAVVTDTDAWWVLGKIATTPPSGGGAGLNPTARLEFAGPNTNSAVTSQASQTKGEIVACTVDATIKLQGARLNTTAGRTYRFRVYEYNPTTGLFALVGTATDVASPGTLTNVYVTTAVNINISRGKYYLIATTDTSGNPVTVWEDTSSNRWVAGPHLHANGNARIAVTDPADGVGGWSVTLSNYSAVVETQAR